MYFPNHSRQYKISQMAMVVDDVQKEVIAMIKSVARSRIDEVEKYLSDHTNDDSSSSRLSSLWKESFQQKILAEAEIKMADIHVMISDQQKKFMEGRLNILSSSSSYYKILRQWEINFIKLHLKPLYEERRQLTPELRHFWEDAIACYKLVEDQITDMDSEILLCLIDINSNWLSDLKGFSLNFIFKDNPYFSNDLTKTYQVIGDNESVTLKASGTKINWTFPVPSHIVSVRKVFSALSSIHMILPSLSHSTQKMVNSKAMFPQIIELVRSFETRSYHLLHLVL